MLLSIVQQKNTVGIVIWKFNLESSHFLNFFAITPKRLLSNIFVHHGTERIDDMIS
jgi:hypothetical protein